MISLMQLRTIPKIKPGNEKQETLDEYLGAIERAVIDAWRNHKASVTIDRKDDVMTGAGLRRYLIEKGFKVTLTRKPPFKIKIFFTEAKF